MLITTKIVNHAEQQRVSNSQQIVASETTPLLSQFGLTNQMIKETRLTACMPLAGKPIHVSNQCLSQPN